ncbi:MAG: tetratricopeptide repeat protein [Candidatus Coatesbacteria bacterium]|nr:tetratricopeptide repeat protein [Candidatus Coatesbacteria bacterium]
MNCQFCNFENPVNFIFCARCGKRISKSENLSQENRLKIESYLPSPVSCKLFSDDGKVEDERRIITILFADISGFTNLTERLDPEVVVDFLNQIYLHLIEVIYKYDGIIDKIIGDEIMALFGVPYSSEDDPIGAIFAARDLLNEIAKYKKSPEYKDFIDKNKKLLSSDFNLNMHCGLETGMGIIGEIGTQQKTSYTVIGDMVNTAKRLSEEAKPNQILIGPYLAKLAKEKIPLVKGSAIKLKGKSQSTQTFLLSKEQEQQPHLQPTIPTPAVSVKPIFHFVGRKKELEFLQKKVKHTIATKKGSVIMLVGEPGIGKSRLVHELISTSPSNVISLEGQAFSYLQRNKYGVFIDMLRKYFVLGADDNLNQIREKIRKSLSPVSTADDRNLPNDLTLLFSSKQDDVKVMKDSLSRKGKVFYAVERFFQLQSQKKSIIALFEDIHWLDKSSAELLDFLISRHSERPIVFLLILRSEKEGYAKNFRENLKLRLGSAYSELHLSKLSIANIKKLISNILGTGDYPQKLQDIILKKADGNPLFAEEIINILKENKAIIQEKERYIMNKEGTSFEIPSTIKGILAASLDRANDAEKKMLQIASIVGKEFQTSLLKVLFEADNQQPILDSLEDKGYIIKHNPGVYMFKHILLYEVVYNMILQKKRDQWHLQLARHIEENWDKNKDEFDQVLAYHYSKGHDYIKAIIYNEKAGDLSKDVYANNTALNFYKLALKYLEGMTEVEKKQIPVERLLEIHNKIGEIYKLVGDYDEAFIFFKKSLQMAEDNKNWRYEIISGNQLGWVYLHQGKYDSAMSVFEKTLKLGQEHKDSNSIAESMLFIANVYANQGNFEKAAYQYKQALRGYQQNNDIAGQANTLRQMSRVLMRRGNYEKMIETLDEVNLLWDQAKDNLGKAKVLHDLGGLYLRLGEAGKALTFFYRAFKVRKEAGDKSDMAWSLNGIGMVYVYANKWEKAEDFLRRSLTTREEIGNRSGVAWSYHDLAFLHLMKGEYNKALEELTIAFDIKNDIGDAYGKARMLALKGMLLLEQGRYSMAFKLIKNAMSIRKMIGDRIGLVRSELDLGRYYLDIGEDKKALKNADKAIENAKNIRKRHILALAYLLKAETFIAMKNLIHALKMAEKAQTIFSKLDEKENIAKVYYVLGKIFFYESLKEGIQTKSLFRDKAKNFFKLCSETMFVERAAFQARFNEEYGFFLYYEGHKKEGIELLDKVRDFYLKIGNKVSYERINRIVMKMEKALAI